MSAVIEYTGNALQEMAEREAERDHRRLRSLSIDPESDPIDILLEVSRLHKDLEEGRRQEP
jgi:hypothetical protein